MIGQTNLIERMDRLIATHKYPRFSIIVGAVGSGRKTVVKHIVKQFGNIVTYQLPDCKVDTVKQMINDSYNVCDVTMYIIPDADSMSVASKNAMLKVTEEPPHNAYFVMTLNSIDNTLPTIQSRATVFTMDNYSINELSNYWSITYPTIALTDAISICETPGDVNLITSLKTNEFFDYVSLVVDNIALVSGCNCFKIANKIALKDELDKYDLRLFFKAFMRECLSRSMSDLSLVGKFCSGVAITSKYLQDLRVNGVNKIMLFDLWVLDIRESWMC